MNMKTTDSEPVITIRVDLDKSSAESTD